jgi:hypothetical protein
MDKQKVSGAGGRERSSIAANHALAGIRAPLATAYRERGVVVFPAEEAAKAVRGSDTRLVEAPIPSWRPSPYGSAEALFQPG